MKAVAIIQARMGSTRLPGKVMRQLAGKSVLVHVTGRVQAVSGIDRTVVATTTDAGDDVVERESRLCGADVFRGSETDVLGRYFLAATEFDADVVVRVTSDCPLLDSRVVENMLQRFMKAAGTSDSVDYMSNGLRRTFPRGLDAEVFTMDALARAHRSATRPYEREHVTPYIYQHPEQFRIHSYEGNHDLSAHRWTLDTEEDFAMLSRVFDALASPTRSPATAEVLELLRVHPEIAQLNATVTQKALGE